MTRGRFWSAVVLKGLVVLFMLFDAVSKLMRPDVVVQSTVELGYAEHHVAAIGVIGLICTVLYAIPRTSVLGAVLLTAYFGGAIATHVRVDSPLFTHILSPVYFAALAWGALWLGNGKVRAMFSLKD